MNVALWWFSALRYSTCNSQIRVMQYKYMFKCCVGVRVASQGSWVLLGLQSLMFSLLALFRA